MKNFKKLLALVLAVIMALGVGSMALAEGGDPLADLVLNGGEEGGSPMIGTFTPPTNRGAATDAYKYMGWASLLDSVPDKTIAEGNYRYLVMTYTGDITQLRFEFARKGPIGDGSDDEKEGPFWFNSEGQTYYFVTADGSAIPLIGNNTTIVIDLANSVNPNAPDGSNKGVGIDWYNDGIHMHCDEMVTHGGGAGYTISNAYLTTSLPSIPSSTEPETGVVTTTAATTTAATTAAATTIAAAEPTTTAEASKMEAIILDGGEEGKSKLIKKFTNTKATVIDSATGAVKQDGYKYLGYVTFKDLANENYKYLALAYTGDIKKLRFQFVHDAGGSNEEMGNVIWFDPEQENHFVTPDGSEIPLTGNGKTIFIDLAASGAEMDWYNSGLHVHVDDIADIDITYAALLTELPKENETLPTKDIVESTAASSAASGNPATGDVSPVAVTLSVCVLSLVILGGALVIRKRY